MTMIQALRSAMDVMLERDANVVVFGQDVGYFGGVFRCTEGLQAKYGKSRVFDAPISEGGIVGAAVGMGAYGLRPVVEIQFADYFYPASDQIVSEAARLRYRSAGDFTAPITIRMPCGGGIYGGQTHSQSPEALFTHVCGIRTVMPSQPVRRQGPADRLDRERRPGHLPRAQAPLQRPLRRPPRPAGRAVVEASAGRGARGLLHRAARVGDGVPPRHATLTVLDLRHDGVRLRRRRPARPASTPRSSTCAASGRSTWTTIVDSVKKTGRCVVVHEATRTSGFGAELVSLVQEHCFYHLEAPIERVTGWDTPYPHAQEWAYFPGPGARRRGAASARWRRDRWASTSSRCRTSAKASPRSSWSPGTCKPGDAVAEDQVLADVMTDKASVEIPSPVAGKVLALGGEVGQTDGGGRRS